MSPKEKAIELLGKFITWSDNRYSNSRSECAKIAVNEIISIGRWIGKEHATRNGFEPESTKEFWEQVINELDEL